MDTRGAPEHHQATPVLEARGIVKHFGAVKALNGVDFTVNPGEVVALIGDNGAGKSTLVNVLTGVIPHDEGEMIFDGEVVHFSSPQDARDHGIETVHQDLAIAPHLDAVANIFLGREKRKGGIAGFFGFLDNKGMTEETIENLHRLNVRVPQLGRRLVTLSGGDPVGLGSFAE